MTLDQLYAAAQQHVLSRNNPNSPVDVANILLNYIAENGGSVDGTPINPSSIGATTPATEVHATEFYVDTNTKWYSRGAGYHTFSKVGDSNVFEITGNEAQIKSGMSFSWSGSDIGQTSDLLLFRDAANTLAQRNGTNAQESRLYGTYTSSTNYERLSSKYDSGSGAFVIETEKGASGGSLRPLEIDIDGTRTAMFWNYGMQFSSGKVLGWTGSSDPTGSAVLGLSLISSGVMGLGAGSGGDITGQLKLNYITTDPLTFAGLKAPATAGEGTRAFITDSTLAFNTTNIGSAAAGGSSNSTPVIVIGGQWVIG